MLSARRLVAGPLLATALAGCGAGARPAAQPSPSPAPATPSPHPVGSPSPSASPTPTRAPAGPPYAVGVRTLTVTDPTRGTPARAPQPAHAGRSLPTWVYYPTAGPAGPADHTGAAPLSGAFPLVAFAHGFNVTPTTYEDLLHEMAADGYVVAAPLFPISASGLPGAAREDDNYQEPGDLSAVITGMLDAGAAGGWLAGAVDGSRVAAVGQSDGGQVVAAMLLIPADRDPRVKAAVLLAPQPPTWGGYAPVAVPALVEQGTADTINPPYLAENTYGPLAAPKAYLDVYGYGHLTSVLGAAPGPVAVRADVDAFLDATLKNVPGAVQAFERYGAEPGLTRLTLDPTRAVSW